MPPAKETYEEFRQKCNEQVTEALKKITEVHERKDVHKDVKRNIRHWMSHINSALDIFKRCDRKLKESKRLFLSMEALDEDVLRNKLRTSQKSPQANDYLERTLKSTKKEYQSELACEEEKIRGIMSSFVEMIRVNTQPILDSCAAIS